MDTNPVKLKFAFIRVHYWSKSLYLGLRLAAI